MTARVIIGTRGADVGMWISPPGKDANSTTFEDLLIDTTRTNTRPIVRGIITPTTLTYNASLSVAPYYLSLGPPVVWGPGSYAVYNLDITHGLGYIPLCHLSVQSDYGGQPFPLIMIDSTKIRLYIRVSWTGYYGNPYPPPPRYGTGTVTFNTRITYTLYRQVMP